MTEVKGDRIRPHPALRRAWHGQSCENRHKSGVPLPRPVESDDEAERAASQAWAKFVFRFKPSKFPLSVYYTAALAAGRIVEFGPELNAAAERHHAATAHA